MVDKFSFLYSMVKGKATLLALVIFFVFPFSPPLFAKSPLEYKGEIKQIQLLGLNLIEKNILFTTIQSKVGNALSPRTVSQDIAALYRLGFFNDVKVNIEQPEEGRVILQYVLTEKPRITIINYKGITQVALKATTDKLKVHLYNMLNEKRIQEDVALIKKEYLEKGYFRSKVSYEVKEIDPQSVSLTYIVEEEPQVYLTEINVTGTEYFYPLDIKRIMQSQEIDCFSWMNQSGKFQVEKMNLDLQIITQTYFMKGFIKVKIDKPDVKLVVNRDYTKVVVDLNITEGDQYFTGKIDIVSDDEWPLLFDKHEVLQNLSYQPGDIFNPFKQNQEQFKINDLYQEQGYAFSRVWSETKIHEDTKIVDTVYHITRGEKAYINRMEIIGNQDTKDYVIRRELEIHDNELYNGVKIRKSQEKITRLGYFAPGEGVKMEKSEENNIDNVLNYKTSLKETQTGTFTASLGYSEYAGVSFMLKLSKRNLFGRGQSVEISSEWTDKGRIRLDFRFTEPYLFDTKLSSSIGLFYLFQKDDDYDSTKKGANYTMGYPIWEYWSSSVRFSVQEEKFSNVTDAGSNALGENESGIIYNSVRGTVSYNSVNHPMVPTGGTSASFGVEHVGGALGGTAEYRQYDFTTQHIHSLNEDRTLIFMGKLRISTLEKTSPDKEIPYTKRFRIGGITTVRGFDWGEIRGPTSSNERSEKFDYANLTEEEKTYYNTHSDGKSQGILNLELLYPLTREGTNIRGLLFLDMGNVWSEERMYELTQTERDYTYVRKSAGVGVRLVTPMGVLRFEYGVKLDKKEEESGSKFDFHISGLF